MNVVVNITVALKWFCFKYNSDEYSLIFSKFSIALAVFQPYNGICWYLNVASFEIFKVSLAVLLSLLFFKIQRNGLLRAKGAVFLINGHNLTSNPTDTKHYYIILIDLISCINESSRTFFFNYTLANTVINQTFAKWSRNACTSYWQSQIIHVKFRIADERHSIFFQLNCRVIEFIFLEL